MTPAAQQALRRTMELHSHSTRFAFACNASNKIIEPIQSRCAIIRYKKLSNTDVITKVLSIMKAEGILDEADPSKNAYTEDGLEAILYLAEGDLRHAINTLQATYVGYRFVSADNVFKVCDQPHPVLIENILVSAIQRRNITEAHAEMSRLLHRGYAPADLLATFFRVAQHNVKLYRTELQQVEVLKAIGETTMRMAEGVSSALQLAGMLARIIEVADPAAA
ncbi:replication factor C subunit 2/4 [Strigomonas culicis]|nr:replication factor C subunit 2/4 [Strigomonas culicis]EPY33536.1 replication factor C subunit 2/4 [Strigomonas culicis]|eukprot:EPY27049.1 replication factor C subunit 2/4 [Strigomonas culicis]